MKAFRLAPIALALLVAGCSTDELLLQRRVDYRSSSDNLSRNPLEVPPDLTSPSVNPAFTVPSNAALAQPATSTSASSQILPTNTKAKLVSAGGQRWLVVRGAPEKLWGEIREFWIANGFILTVDNPTTGVMETDWLENHAKLPQDMLTRMLGKISRRLASTGELDKFRTRLERGEDGTTEIFVSHQGMIEAYRDDGTTQIRNQDAVADTIWIPRPSEPELEAEMISLLLQHFGMDQEAARAVVTNPAEQIAKAELVTLSSGSKALNIQDTYDRAWRRTGLALERIGFVITDRDRTQGTYFVRRAEVDIGKEQSDNFLSGLAFWRSKKEEEKKAAQLEYLVQLKQEPSRTTLTVKPKSAANQALEQQLLDGLLKQLK